jgi:hypothetical protein
MLMNNTSKTDWARIDAMTDDDIDTSDTPPLDEAFFAKAKLRMPQLMSGRSDPFRVGEKVTNGCDDAVE